MRYLSMVEPPDPLPDFEFGFGDGMPLFVPGPNGSEKMIYNVLDTLDTHVGPAGYFHYFMPLLTEPDFILEPDAAEDA